MGDDVGDDVDTLDADRELPTAHVSLEAGTLVDGRYRLVGRIGRGGMGEVWEATHVPLGRACALKFLQPHDGPSRAASERFLQEARLLSEIRHPNLVEVWDFGRWEGGAPYLVMERLEGRSLATELRACGPLPWPRVIAIALEAVDGLAVAHERGIVHRDLKPANLFLTGDASDHVKVLDFGIAKRVAAVENRDDLANLTATGAVFGTPAYMAPEQIRAQPVDARTDIYGLGCVLFEMLTGDKPFPGPLFDSLAGHLHRAPPPLPPEVPRALARLVRRCLVKSPARRYRAAHQLRRALQAASASTVFAACRSSGTWPRTLGTSTSTHRAPR